ncbi:efflux RND transporter permease subunit [Candidatus Peregrinibacteria bacterium]|nr:efflux RND transporter permease subunit [Candidatus Peregrinibacteria bacterium]
MSVEKEKSKVLEELKDIANSFWGFFIFNKRMAIMLGLMFLITGVYSYLKMPLESEPEVKVPYGMVMTTYPGASPIEVAEQVTYKIEQKIKSLEDLEEMTSSSGEGVSSIFVEFDAKADIETSIRKLKDKVDEAKATLPSDANDPIVQELSFSSSPIINFGFYGDLPYEQLLSIVEDVQGELEKITGIQSATVVGKRTKHILVAVRENDMMQYGLNLRTISRAISAFHANSPVGNIEIDELLYRVRIEAEQENVELVKNIPIVTRNGATVYLKDVANVVEELQEATTMSRVSENGNPSKQAISISVVKKTGDNVIKTVDEARAIIDEMYANGKIPAEVQCLEINDMSEYVKTDFYNLMKNALQTIALIFIMLFLALGFKEALIGGIAIPFTFLVTFTYLNQIGYTFNFLVLFSLILGLGLLVDATIVIMEGIHEFLYIKKMSPVNAALMAIKTYRYPLMSGMLTTVAAFVPMLMMSGIMGQFFKFIPITVSAVLISSLVIGLFIIPAFAVIFMSKAGEKKESDTSRFLRHKRREVIAKINAKYQELLNFLLEKKKRRKGLFSITTLVFISALLLPALGLVKIEGFPLVDVDFMYIDAEAPIGTTLEKLDPIVKKIEKVVQEDPNIESYVLNMGTGGNGGNSLGSASSSTHLATMSINFVNAEKRTQKSYEIAEGYKDKLAFITEAEIKVPELRSGPPTGSAVQVRLFGDDYKVLKQISNDIRAKLNELGAQQVDDDISTGTAEFTFDFSDSYKKAVLSNYGLNVMDVSQEVRMAVYPTKAATIKRGDEEIDIDVQRDWDGFRPSSIDAVKSIQIQNPTGKYISLSSLANPTIGASLTSIKHVDGDQVVTVSADVGKDQVPADILDELNPFLESYEWPVGYSYKMAGGNDDTMQSFKDLLNAMSLAVLLIFLILIAQFNSFKQPIVILMALPLSLIGVLYGFFFFRLNVGVSTMIGIVALSGIVINDAIVLIDRININRRTKDMDLIDAIKEAGPARLQPIIITSVTTILGVLPISLTDPFWLTLGMAIVFGMAFSTILTLIIIPVLYFSFEAKRECRRLRKAGRDEDAKKLYC